MFSLAFLFVFFRAAAIVSCPWRLPCTCPFQPGQGGDFSGKSHGGKDSTGIAQQRATPGQGSRGASRIPRQRRHGQLEAAIGRECAAFSHPGRSGTGRHRPGRPEPAEWNQLPGAPASGRPGSASPRTAASSPADWATGPGRHRSCPGRCHAAHWRRCAFPTARLP